MKYVPRFYCTRCSVLFKDDYPEYADRTPCPRCDEWALMKYVPEGSWGRMTASELIEIIQE